MLPLPLNRLVSADTMKEIDRLTIQNWKIPGAVLMNNAGKAIFDYVRSEKWHSVAVVCGSGNNGGDGFAAAMYLHAAGIDVTVFFDSSKEEKLSAESGTFYQICRTLDIVRPYQQDYSYFECIVDCILGIGISGAVRGSAATQIESINNSPSWIISADIPSGLPASGAVIDGSPVVKAQTTLTMGLQKINTAIHPGASFAGTVVVADIGFPKNLLSSYLEGEDAYLFDEQLCESWGDIYANTSLYKYRAGTVCMIGGFPGYEGALQLAVSSLLESGVGMSYAFSHRESDFTGRNLPPELIFNRLDEVNLKNQLGEVLSRSDVLLIGPGLGRSEFSRTVFQNAVSLLDSCNVRFCVADADALFFLQEKHSLRHEARLVLTPHSGEAAHLLSMKVSEIESDRMKAAHEISRRYRAICLLKGPGSLITDGIKSIVSTAGNSLLATAGSGDVLSGMIASTLNRYKDPCDAVSAAVHVHGTVADIAGDSGAAAFKASDIVRGIRPALQTIFERTGPLKRSGEFPLF